MKERSHSIGKVQKRLPERNDSCDKSWKMVECWKVEEEISEYSDSRKQLDNSIGASKNINRRYFQWTSNSTQWYLE